MAPIAPDILLRTTSFPPLTTKGSEILGSEFDANYIKIYNSILEAVAAGSYIPAFSGYTTYSAGQFARYAGLLWYFINDTPTAGVNPGSDEDFWINVSPSVLAHFTNKDTKLAEGTGDEVSASAIKSFLYSAPFVQVTIAELNTLIAAGTLVRGKYYFVSDKADAGIFLYAGHGKSTVFQGYGVFSNADYQMIGDFTDVNIANGFSVDTTNVNLGKWNISNMAPNAGDIVIYNRLHWLNLTGAVGTAPDGDATNWQLIPNVQSGLKNGYFIEVDYIEYDIVNDWFISRNDKRGNKVKYSKVTDDQIFAYTQSAINTFQYGNDQWVGNELEESFINAINFTGSISRNKLRYSNIDNLYEDSGYAPGIIRECNLDRSVISAITFANVDTIIQRFNLSANSSFKYAVLGNVTYTDITLISSNWDDNSSLIDPISNKIATPQYSNLERVLDLDDASIFSSNKITIPTGCGAYGRFKLIKTGATATINKIASGTMPSCEFRIYPEAGLAATISYAAIAGIATEKIAGTGGGSSTVLDGDKSHWLDLKNESGVNYLQKLFQYD